MSKNEKFIQEFTLIKSILSIIQTTHNSINDPLIAKLFQTAEKVDSITSLRDFLTFFKDFAFKAIQNLTTEFKIIISLTTKTLVFENIFGDTKTLKPLITENFKKLLDDPSLKKIVNFVLFLFVIQFLVRRRVSK